MKGINELRDKIHENAKRKGFYEDEKYIDVLPSDLISANAVKHAFFAQKIALIHSELSEALEAYRRDIHANMDILLEATFNNNSEKIRKQVFDDYIKNSVEDELADVIIRVLDLCGWLNIDIEKHIELKMKYNEQREHKHGKEY